MILVEKDDIINKYDLFKATLPCNNFARWNMNKTKRKISLISSLHYVKLIYRSALFLVAAVMYILSRIQHTGQLFHGFEESRWVLILIAVVYAAEMIARFFPSRLESMGCQKQFARNHRPTGEEKPVLMSGKRTFAVVAAWLGLNGLIGLIYFLGWIDAGILVLISLTYGVCDMICILFFCPFQTWFMKNRCCTVCRIYNWDFAMMFTPFVFIPSPFTWSLLGMSLALLARWELTYRRHPQRFSERTNQCLSCANCQEKLCHHKKQLRQFWERNKSRFNFWEKR